MSNLQYSTDELYHMWKDCCDEIDSLRVEVQEAYGRGREDGYQDGYEAGYDARRHGYEDHR
jgi:flagellar biosynthesis/type III secretory pathway protein FliH